MSFFQYARDNAWYGWGYLQGRSSSLPTSFSDLYAQVIAKGTSLLTLPLPLLSFLALPLFGGSSATINAFFFYVTWSSLVLSYGELKIEIMGTLVLRLVFFVFPALIFLAFDAVLPKQSKNIKARGLKHHPTRLNRDRLAAVVGISLFNVLLAVALQASLEVVCTKVLHLRSLIKVTKGVIPFPWSIIKDLLQGFVIRGFVHYAIHRYLLHTYDSVLKTWHLKYQHRVFPFSLVAAYDHPVPYLLVTFPTFLPAYLFRWHVLTWFIFVILTSLEELFVYSGYSVLPSTIILTGMARRTEAHFESVKKPGKPGNFGRWGVLDLVCRTTCEEESTVMDDFQDEAEKRRFQERVEIAVQDALDGIDRKQGRKSGEDAGTNDDVEDDEVEYPDKDADNTGARSSAIGQVGEKVAGLMAPRRSGRRKGR